MRLCFVAFSFCRFLLLMSLCVSVCLCVSLCVSVSLFLHLSLFISLSSSLSLHLSLSSSLIFLRLFVALSLSFIVATLSSFHPPPPPDAGSDAVVDDAVQAARTAFPRWATEKVSTRVKVLHTIADLLQDRRADIATCGRCVHASVCAHCRWH